MRKDVIKDNNTTVLMNQWISLNLFVSDSKKIHQQVWVEHQLIIILWYGMQSFSGKNIHVISLVQLVIAIYVINVNWSLTVHVIHHLKMGHLSLLLNLLKNTQTNHQQYASFQRCFIQMVFCYMINTWSNCFKCNCFHELVYADGSICLDILQNRWSPTYDVSAILTSIQSLLDEPNPNSPANSLAAQLYQENRREYEKRVAAIVEQSWLNFNDDEEKEAKKES